MPPPGPKRRKRRSQPPLEQTPLFVRRGGSSDHITAVPAEAVLAAREPIAAALEQNYVDELY